MRNALPLALIMILAACQSGLLQSSAAPLPTAQVSHSTPSPPTAMSSPTLQGEENAQGTRPPTVQPSASTSPQAVDLRWDTSPTARIIRYYSPYTTAGLAGAYNRAYYIPEAQVWGDGRIIWVSYKGSERRVLAGQLTTDQMEALLQRIAEAGFFAWQDEYYTLGGNSTPPMRLAVSLLGQSKEVQEHGGAPEVYYELAEWLSNGAGASGSEYTPRQGYLTASCWPDIETITAATEWPAAASGFTLDQIGNGRYIENEVLAFAWQVVNQHPRGPVNVNSNNHDCVIMVQIPGVSFFEPPPPSVSTPAPSPPAANLAVPQITLFTVTPTNALTIGDTISLTWQAQGERAEICFISGQPIRCQAATLTGGRAITVEETMLTQAIDGVGLRVTASEVFTWSIVPLDFQCRGSGWFFANPPATCPATEPVYAPAAAQYFEHGFMIWTEQPDRFYVFYEEGQEFVWTEAPYTFKTPEPVGPATPPPGAYEPKSGFGQVWRGEIAGLDNIRQRLGWATGPEFSFEAAYQCALTTAYYHLWSCYLRGPAGQVLWLHPDSTAQARFLWAEWEEQ